MGSCSVKLPAGSDKRNLESRLNNIIQDMGPLSESLLGDAAREFFQETTRWRYQATVELSCGDQHIDLEIPDGLRARLVDPIKLQMHGCDEYDVYERKDQNRSDDRNNGYGGYENRQIGSYGSTSNYRGSIGYWRSNCDRPLAFYQPHSNKILFSEPVEHCTVELVIIFWPKDFNAIDCVPETLMEDYRDGIIGMAVEKAMELPQKPWTTPSEGYSPNRVKETYSLKAHKAMEAAKLFYSANISSRRPHGDRMSAARNGQSRRHGRLHRW